MKSFLLNFFFFFLISAFSPGISMARNACTQLFQSKEVFLGSFNFKSLNPEEKNVLRNFLNSKSHEHLIQSLPHLFDRWESDFEKFRLNLKLENWREKEFKLENVALDFHDSYFSHEGVWKKVVPGSVRIKIRNLAIKPSLVAYINAREEVLRFETDAKELDQLSERFQFLHQLLEGIRSSQLEKDGNQQTLELLKLSSRSQRENLEQILTVVDELPKNLKKILKIMRDSKPVLEKLYLEQVAKNGIDIETKNRISTALISKTSNLQRLEDVWSSFQESIKKDPRVAWTPMYRTDGFEEAFAQRVLLWQELTLTDPKIFQKLTLRDFQLNLHECTNVQDYHVLLSWFRHQFMAKEKIDKWKEDDILESILPVFNRLEEPLKLKTIEALIIASFRRSDSRFTVIEKPKQDIYRLASSYRYLFGLVNGTQMNSPQYLFEIPANKNLWNSTFSQVDLMAIPFEFLMDPRFAQKPVNYQLMYRLIQKLLQKIESPDSHRLMNIAEKLYSSRLEEELQNLKNLPSRIIEN